MSTIPNEKKFTMYGDGAIQMFNWLTPYIEAAGYKWEQRDIKGPLQVLGGREITITKA